MCRCSRSTTPAFAKPAARKAFSLACGHRGRLNGLDALPPTARLGPGCPAAPRCARASAFYVRVPRTANRIGKPRAVGSPNALARPQAGAGVLAPPQDLPRLGPLSAVGLVSPAAPPCALTSLGAGQLLRPRGLRIPSGASALGRCVVHSPDSRTQWTLPASPASPRARSQRRPNQTELLPCQRPPC